MFSLSLRMVLKMKPETSLNYGTMPLDMAQLAVGLVAQEIGFVYWGFHRGDGFRRGAGEGRFQTCFMTSPLKIYSANIRSACLVPALCD
jgi:hypothetical protein